MNQSGCCWTTRSMAASTSGRSTALRRVQNVSGSPMPYLQAVAAGEAGAEGATVGDGDAPATGVVAGTGAEGVEPPPQVNAVAASAASRPVGAMRNFIPSLPAGGLHLGRKAAA